MLIDAEAWFESHDREVKDMIIKLIQDKQLIESGVDSEGRVIGYYSELTEILSEGRKKQGAFVINLQLGNPNEILW